MAQQISKIFKPRRGNISTMTVGTKKTVVLAAGEMFIEVPDTGQGTGKCKMKIGDGVSTYPNLPYAMGDTENESIMFAEDSSGTTSLALEKVRSGASLKTMIAALKRAIQLNMVNISEIDSKIGAQTPHFKEGQEFQFGRSGDTYGYYKAGADTLTPFKTGINRVKLGVINNNTNTTFMLSGYPGYQNFTVQNNIFLKVTDIYVTNDVTSWSLNNSGVVQSGYVDVKCNINANMNGGMSVGGISIGGTTDQHSLPVNIAYNSSTGALTVYYNNKYNKLLVSAKLVQNGTQLSQNDRTIGVAVKLNAEVWLVY